MRTTATAYSSIKGGDDRGCAALVVRDASRVRWRDRFGRPLPDLWMLPPQRGKRGGRYNRRAVALLSAYHPHAGDDENPWEDGNPYSKRQYRRAWEIGRLLSATVQS